MLKKQWITAKSGKGNDMRKNDKNTFQTGYPQQNGYPQGSYPVGNAYAGYQAPQGYMNQPDYQAPQGYPQATGYAPMQGYQTARNYQTPQVPVAQPQENGPDPSTGYAGQGTFVQPGYTQPQAGYSSGSFYPQQTGYPQGNAGMTGYSNPVNPPAGSYIPQTPYSPGYMTPGYQTGSGYNNGYSAYTQMGRQQPISPMPEAGGQVPLNGGGYVPQPVLVRKRPFELTDAHLLVFSAVLLALFALGMFMPGVGVLKWVFLFLSIASAVTLWVKPLTDNNKRLCYTVVFGLLALVTVFSAVNSGQQGQQTDPQQVRQEQNSGGTVSSVSNPYENGTIVTEKTPAPTVSAEIVQGQEDEVEMKNRVGTFFTLWHSNSYSQMVSICDPSWRSNEENAEAALFKILGTRTPVEFEIKSISGTPYDTNRTVKVYATIDKNTGKDPIKYDMNINVIKNEDDGAWYIDPKSIKTNEPEEPTVTPTPAPTPTPNVDPNAIMYYNPNGGKFYHADPNCPNIAAKYLPLQGKFKFSEINDEKYKDLKACHICNSPNRPK